MSMCDCNQGRLPCTCKPSGYVDPKRARQGGDFAPPAGDVEAVCEVVDEKYNRVRFYRQTGDTSKPYHEPGAKLYDQAHVTRLTAESARLQAELQVANDRLSIEVDTSNKLGSERDALKAEVERLKAGPDHFCGGPMSVNPHADAGIPGRYLEVGATRECIPCLVKSRHDWANKANALQSELTKVRDLVRKARRSIDPSCAGKDLRTELDEYLAHQSAPAANPIACKVDQSCEKDSKEDE